MEIVTDSNNERGFPQPEYLKLPSGGEVVLRKFNGQLDSPVVLYCETAGIIESFDIKMKALQSLSSSWHNFNFVHIALPGFLDAFPPPVTNMSTYIEALNVVYEHLNHDKPPIWVGHSTPTAFLTRFAKDYPEKVGLLVLSCPPLHYDRAVYKKLMPGVRKLIEKRFDGLSKKVKSYLLRTILCETEDVIAKLTPEQMDSVVATVTKAVVNGDNHLIVDGLRVPTLVLQGENDILAPSFMSKEITNPSVEFKKFKGGHVDIFKKLYDPTIVNRVFDKWKKVQSGVK